MKKKILSNYYLSIFACILAIVMVGCASTAAVVNEGAATVLPSGGIVIDPPHTIADATLTDQSGKPMHLTDLRGRVSIVFFGYTNCPDVCPITVSDWTRVKKSLGPDADKAAFVFLSVDPARDTPAKLATYLGAFDTSFIGLTTDLATVKKIGQDFGAIFTPPDAGGGVGQSPPAYLIDSNFQIRVKYPVSTKPPAIAPEIPDFGKNGAARQ